MEQISAEARTDGSDLGDIKRCIDGKGVVIFMLGSGGTIRDTGKKVFSFRHDPKAEHATKLHADKERGRNAYR
jgi:hypothetical protein